jgi:hypothetical protein
MAVSRRGDLRRRLEGDGRRESCLHIDDQLTATIEPTTATLAEPANIAPLPAALRRSDGCGLE